MDEIFNLDVFEFAGLSMAPWLMPHDIITLKKSYRLDDISVGDVVVIQNNVDQRICHRVVRRSKMSRSFPLVLKGDRVPFCDVLSEDWRYVGKADERIRSGKKSKVIHSPILAWMSLYGLYPGQKLPISLSRSALRKLFQRQ